MLCTQCGKGQTKRIATFADFAAQARAAEDERRPIFSYIEGHPAAAFDEFIACQSCGVIRVNPTPTPETLTGFYQNYYANQQYSNKEVKKIKRTRRRLAKLRRYLDVGTFLDVGCNLGFAVEAARREGFSATGIEIDAQAVKLASARFPEASFTATMIADYQPAQPFDLVYCTEVIEHVPDTVDFMKHLARVTKPGGHLYLTTPDAGHWRRPTHFVQWPEVKPLEHVNWQTQGSMRQLLADCGFDCPRFFFNLKPGMRLLARRL